MRFAITIALTAYLLVSSAAGRPLGQSIARSRAHAVGDAVKSLHVGAHPRALSNLETQVDSEVGAGIGIGLGVSIGDNNHNHCHCQDGSLTLTTATRTSTATPSAPTTTLVHPTPPSNIVIVDIHVWLNGLALKVDAILKLIDGHSSPDDAILKIIAEVNAAVRLLVAAEVKLAGDVNVPALVNAVVALLSNIVITVSKCGTVHLSVIAHILLQLDACLKGLVAAIAAHIGGFLEACGQALVHVDLFSALHLDALLKILLHI